ncbi:MAG: LptF/LptG family permease [bacterium]
MKILDKYIFKQVAFATILGIIVFIIVWISPEILFKIVKKVVYGEISANIALKLFFLEMPEILGKAIPVGLMIGSLFVFDRLSKDSELTIIKGIGVSFIRLILPVLVLSAIGVWTCFIINEHLIPYSTSTLKTLKHDINQSHFVYVDKTKSGKPKQILIIGNYDGTNMEDIKLLKFPENATGDTSLIQTIITANSAKYTANNWILENGTEYQIAPNGVYKNIISFKSLNIFSPDSSMKAFKLLVNSAKKAKEMTLTELHYYIKLLKSMDMQDEFHYFLNKYHQRFSLSFSCILFSICGVILGFSKPREKRYLGFTIGVGIIFLYYLIIPFLEMLSQIGIISPMIAAWVPNIIVFILIFILIKQKQVN